MDPVCYPNFQGWVEFTFTFPLLVFFGEDTGAWCRRKPMGSWNIRRYFPHFTITYSHYMDGVFLWFNVFETYSEAMHASDFGQTEKLSQAISFQSWFPSIFGQSSNCHWLENRPCKWRRLCNNSFGKSQGISEKTSASAEVPLLSPTRDSRLLCDLGIPQDVWMPNLSAVALEPSTLWAFWAGKMCEGPWKRGPAHILQRRREDCEDCHFKFD